MNLATGARRRLSVALFAVGLVALAPVTAGLAVGTAGGNAPLGSVNVGTTATGLRMPFYSHQGEDVEGELPFAASQLGAGGQGHAVTSLFWPGSTGASGGSTLAVVGPSLPAPLQPVVKLIAPFENYLNDPYKAEAPTIKGDTKVSKSSPGVIMQALALPNHVNASSAIGPSNLSSFGDDAGPLISATTNIVQNADNVVADAKSAVDDIAVGPLSIGAVTSTAHATADATSATGETETQITGVKVAGIAVTIDQNGVELANKGVLPAKVVAGLTKTVNSALNSAGLRLYLIPATKLIHRSEVSLVSSALVLSLNKPGYRAGSNDTGMVLQIGGVTINANAAAGYVAPTISPTTPATGNPVPPGGNPIPPLSNPTFPGGSSQVMPTTAPAPVLAANPLSLPGALSSWWVVAGILLTLFAAFALGLWPARAFTAGATCSLEEES